MKYAGMEQWGAVTYIGRFLQAQPNELVSNFATNLQITSHEISHMWMGDLASFKWWDEVWLSEAFARFLEIKCLTQIRPNYHFDRQCFPLITVNGFALDYNPESNLEVPFSLEVPDSVFGFLVYDKGSSVVRMFEDFVGPETFRDVFREYLKVFQFKHATGEGFLQILGDVAGSETSDLMRTWIKLRGFPVVTVEKVNDLTYQLTQAPYGPVEDAVWGIPVKFYTDDFVVHSVVLNQKTMVLELERPSEWIKLNYQALGFYYVKYDAITWQGIVRAVGGFGTLDRTGLLHNYIQFSRKNREVSRELAELIVANVPEFNHPYFYLLQKHLKVDRPGTGARRVLERVFSPFWEKYGLNIADEADLFVEETAYIVYSYLVCTCHNEGVSRSIYEAHLKNALPSILSPLVDYAMLHSLSDDTLGRAVDSVAFARVLLHSTSCELVSTVLLACKDSILQSTENILSECLLSLNGRTDSSTLLSACLKLLSDSELEGKLADAAVQLAKFSNPEDYDSLRQLIEETGKELKEELKEKLDSAKEQLSRPDPSRELQLIDHLVSLNR